jgi:hypothetical protein
MMTTTVPRHNDGVIYRELQAGEAVLLHVGTGAYHGLSPTAAAIWRLIDGQRDADAIAAELAEAFEDSPDDLAERVARFVSLLGERDLVQAT